MKRIVALVLAGLLSINVVWAQDFDTGMAALERGDYTTALNILRPLAEGGSAHAQTALALVYNDGIGVTVDHKRAVSLLRSAVMSGHPLAQNDLAVMYAKGLGVPQDFVSAHLWFNISCAFPYDTACQNRDQLSARMLPADISEAQRRARICMASNYKDCD